MVFLLSLKTKIIYLLMEDIYYKLIINVEKFQDRTFPSKMPKVFLKIKNYIIGYDPKL